jgi:hypothetical protein
MSHLPAYLYKGSMLLLDISISILYYDFKR